MGNNTQTVVTTVGVNSMHSLHLSLDNAAAVERLRLDHRLSVNLRPSCLLTLSSGRTRLTCKLELANLLGDGIQ